MEERLSQLPIMRLRELLRKRRDALGLTQLDVARAVGVTSPDFISLVEKGIRNLDLDRVPRLAEVLRVDSPELCRIALEEQYPLLAHALLQTPARRRQPISEADAAAEKLKLLPRNLRIMAINMIDALSQRETRSTRSAVA